MIRRIVSVVSGLVVGLALAAPSAAGTIFVGGACALADAVTAANVDIPFGGCPAGDGDDTIVLQPGATYTLDTVNNDAPGGSGPNAFPVVTTFITILGNGATIERASTAPDFRFFEVEGPFDFLTKLRLENLTLRGGRIQSGYSHTPSCAGGGAIRAHVGSLELHHVTLTENEVRLGTGCGFGGGAIFMWGVEATITDSALTSNVSALDDGAIWGLSGTLSLESTIVDGNHGGGITMNGGSLDVRRSVISRNVGDLSGGIGIFIEGTCLIANTTISGNRATGAAPGATGGFVSTNDTTITIVNTTISNNEADQAGAVGGLNVPAAIELGNSIVAGNRVGGNGTAPRADCSGGPIAATFDNLYGIATGCPQGGPTDVLVAPGNVFTTVLGPLALNPPGTTETHALRAGSPALDAAHPAVCVVDPVSGVDQRGVLRPQGVGCDIGAFELTPGGPNAVDDVAFTDEDTPVVIAVLANDSDPDGDPLAITAHTQGAHGSVSDNGDGTLTYAPQPDFAGSDAFTYTISDGNGGTDTATVSVTVTPVNDAPVAGDDDYAAKGITLTVNAGAGVLANDVDPEGDALTAVLVSGPAHGLLLLGADGSFKYTPDAGFAGTDGFTYKARDAGGAESNVATATILVNANQPPMAFDDGYSVASDTTLKVAGTGVLANDIDPDGVVLSAVLVASPANGTLDLHADGSFAYTPTAGFVGTDSFTYQASDGIALSNVATVDLTVTGVGFKKISGTTTPIPGGTGLFSGFPAGPLSGAGSVAFLGLGAGQLGVYGQVAGAAGLVELADLATPIPGGSGTFTALSDPALSAQPGDPCQEAAFVGAGSSGQQGIYATSFGDASCASSPIALANRGTAIPSGSGTFTTLSDPALSAQPGDPCLEAAFVGAGSGGQQGIYATSFGDASCATSPIALANLATPIPGGNGTFTALSDPALSAQPGDPCHEAAFVGAGSGGQQGIYATSFGDASCATTPIALANLATPIPGGTGTFAALSDPALSAIPGDPCHDAAFIGAGSSGQQGIYKVSFGDASCAGAPIKVADAATSIPQGLGTFTGFLDLSASGAHVAFLATGSGGQKGIYLASTLTKIVDLSDVIAGETLTDLRFARGGLAGNQLGFAATFSDGSQGVFIAEVDFPGANEPPLANPDGYTTNEDTALVVAAPGVLGNDVDPEGAFLIATLVSGPVHGSLSLGTDGSFSYTPNANFNGGDSFAYAATDSGGAGSNVATVTVAVAPVNDAPLAANDAYATAEDTPLVVAAPGVLANDADPEGGALTASLVSGPAFGVLNLNANGSFSYTPNLNFAGSDSFRYTASDGSAPSNTATVTIQVSAVNDAPVAVGDSYTTSQATPLTVAAPGVLGNDSDPDSPSLTALLVSGPANGTLSLGVDGSFIYAPNAGFSGTDGFSYRASDGVAVSGPAAVSIVVQAVSGQAWKPTGSLNTARTAHTATVLPNGKVLVAGGYGPSGLLKSAELYDPATGKWSPTGSLKAARSGHGAVALASGKVLVTGGLGTSGLLKSAELYDPATGAWSATGNLQAARAAHTTEPLSNGKVLVAGGLGTSGLLKTAEIYDPTTGSWSATGSLGTARTSHSATRLSNGKVVAAGGLGPSGVLKSAELYDPATGKWSATGSLKTASALHAATRLADGRVLVAGGAGAGGTLARAELFNPGTGSWTQAGSLAVARSVHTATLLPDGKVLAAGGIASNLQSLAASEIFDPASAQWSPADDLDTARGNHTATLLSNGKVLAAGGGVTGLASAELFGTP